jgi:ketosteroid isomerase-like protein
METQNIQVVKNAYAAFGRGDVQGILDCLTDDVQWIGAVGEAAHVPMAGERRGKAEVAEFFRLVGEHMHFTQFDPRDFAAAGDKVLVLGHYVGTTSAHGTLDADFVMVFTVRNGKIARFQEFTDTAAVNAAFAPAAVHA